MNRHACPLWLARAYGFIYHSRSRIRDLQFFLVTTRARLFVHSTPFKLISSSEVFKSSRRSAPHTWPVFSKFMEFLKGGIENARHLVDWRFPFFFFLFLLSNEIARQMLFPPSGKWVWRWHTFAHRCFEKKFLTLFSVVKGPKECRWEFWKKDLIYFF